MNIRNRDLRYYRRLAGVLGGLLLVAFASVYFFDASAQTEDVEMPVEQNLTLGRLAFSSRIAGPTTPVGRIFTVDPDGSGGAEVPISSPVPFASEPAWSPDGTRLAFSWTQSPQDLYVINADGSGQANLTNTTDIREKNPSWSVTGKIAYERDPNTVNAQIWVINPDGSGNVQFSGITQPFPASPTWSPDGTKLAFTSGGEIWVIDADGTNERRVTINATTDSDPAWSPDGTKFVFEKSESGIAVINTDGTNEISLGANGNHPTWSPDGTKIAFTRNGIYTMDANGGNQVRIVANIILFPQCCDTVYEYPAWQPVVQTAVLTSFDFDGDGRSDVSVFRPSDGVWHLLRSESGYASAQWGFPTDVLTPADYDGDLKTDIVVWRPTEGNFYILNSFNNTVRIENFGLSGDVPTGGDWDGDGKADVAVYRGGAQGIFYYRGSMGNPQGNISQIPWGVPGDKTVVGDYDGDGLTDAAIFRPSDGTWYIRQSSNGQLSADNFGLSGDILVPADYDADGRTDLAVYRSGIWYLWRSTQGFAAFQFGISTDVPAPADYDGDGSSDAAIYRNGGWWILNSQSGSVDLVLFGVSSDIPVPSAFVR